MSEKREVYMAWSDTAGKYRGSRCDLDWCQEQCRNFNRGDITDYRPQRIPPPAEIESNARDAARFKAVLAWIEWQDNLLPCDFSHLNGPEYTRCRTTKHLVGNLKLAIEDAAIDAAMEGGE